MKNFVTTIGILQIFCVISTSSSSCGSRCDSLSYCDNYEAKCNPCSDICEGNGFSSIECSKQCPQYIQNAFSAMKLETSQLHTLTIMVAVTAVMTCLVLILLTVMLLMKYKKKRKLAKKILPGTLYDVQKDKIKMVDSKLETLNAQELASNNRPRYDATVSTSTLTTQVSNGSGNQSHNSSSERVSEGLSSKQRRFPSEDCVPQYDQYLSNPYGSSRNQVSKPKQYSEVVWMNFTWTDFLHSNNKCIYSVSQKNAS